MFGREVPSQLLLITMADEFVKTIDRNLQVDEAAP